ncbi:hypothetical protein MAMP_01899 [Methylophaga aminisulfidivorans MP]|uniref:Uncharacterized protein n=1 Tax=Methylophaga aminisulfidivorans MP TaxID=1026882 RepID=F5SX12_9GAMM|nr:hypothetical protein MAMP_01899 [Methylophaga aminisulfidivorans MP]
MQVGSLNIFQALSLFIIFINQLAIGKNDFLCVRCMPLYLAKLG